MEATKAKVQFGSVCSGIEAASLAWEPMGWEPAWFSEIEPFPSAVLAHRWPHVMNHGDMTAMAEKVANGNVPAPDVFTGGTPCQAFSVAGKRQSLADDCGNLSLTFCEIADAIDNARCARGEPETIIMWENVPGVLSTGDNAFGCFLARLAGHDQPLEPGPRPEPGRSSAHWRWKKDAGEHVPAWPDAGVVAGPRRTVAWRVLDAQYFGLAQRRRRVFVVASARNGFDPGEVLFEFDGVRRDSPPSREAGETVTHDVAPCLTSSGRGVERCGDTRGQDPVVAVAFGQNRQSGPVETSHALNAHSGPHGRLDFESETFLVQCVHGTQDPCVDDHVGFALGRNSGQENAVCVTGKITHTLKADGFDGSEDGTGRGQPIVAFDTTQITHPANQSNPRPGDPCHTLPKAGHAPAIATAMRVRRLIPLECERLQGVPDGHTDVPYRGKPAADGPRYKAIGNSWAVLCARWIGWRIDRRLRAANDNNPQGAR